MTLSCGLLGADVLSKLAKALNMHIMLAVQRGWVGGLPLPLQGLALHAIGGVDC